MPLKNRLRMALGRSSPDSTRSNSTTSSTSTSHSNLHNVLTMTPSNVPAITLTKTSTSSSRLSKITSWRSSRDKSKYPPLKNSKHQEILGGFEMKFGRSDALRQSMDGRWSIFSGVSPCASRNGSVDLRRESVASKRRSSEVVREIEVRE